MSEDFWNTFEIGDEPSDEAPLARYPENHREASSEGIGMGTYLTVSSNDTLTHLALKGSPETLCGRLIADEKRPSKDLMCDVCQELTGNSFINTAARPNPWGYELSGKPLNIPCGEDVGGCGYVNKRKLKWDHDPNGDSFAYFTPDKCDKCGSYLGALNDFMGDGLIEQFDTSTVGRPSHPQHPSAPRKDPRDAHSSFVNTAHVDEGEFAEGKSGIEHHKEDFEDWEEEASPFDIPVPPKKDTDKGWGIPDTLPEDWNEGPEPHFATIENIDTCDNCGTKTQALVQQGNEMWCINCASTVPVQKAAAARCDDCGGKDDVRPVRDGRNLCDECRYVYQYGDEEPVVDFNVDDYSGLRGTKVARNYTRDGAAIENGFDVILTTEEASQIPFLDLSRITISQRVECPDCHENQWMQSIASCDTCGDMKCRRCMATVDTFLGQCKKCASFDPDIVYEDTVDEDRALFLSYTLNEEFEEPLFLPNDEI